VHEIYCIHLLCHDRPSSLTSAMLTCLSGSWQRQWWYAPHAAARFQLFALSASAASSHQRCCSGVGGNFSRDTVVALVARYSRQLTCPTDWVFVTPGPLRCA